jgi:uncharacterized protein (TIGR02266 family)
MNPAGRESQPAPRLRLRQELRVQTDLPAEIHVGGRRKEAVVRNLSAGGAFLETQRPSVPGAQLVVEISLPEFAIRAEAQVVYTNVPGNLKSLDMPVGMGVRFSALDAETEADLRHYVNRKAERLAE